MMYALGGHRTVICVEHIDERIRDNRRISTVEISSEMNNIHGYILWKSGLRRTENILFCWNQKTCE
jgi:hypothetical protein